MTKQFKNQKKQSCASLFEQYRQPPPGDGVSQHNLFHNILSKLMMPQNRYGFKDSENTASYLKNNILITIGFWATHSMWAKNIVGLI